ncbi:MAG: TlpA family protein disulfide reductase [Spirochaetaceae bacterium]|jgi:thiol-disulfide isomerase/thioredoxin|nr:TlpA family protein disulfide reductase [Spirochaetaceae bacterium]
MKNRFIRGESLIPRGSAARLLIFSVLAAGLVLGMPLAAQSRQDRNIPQNIAEAFRRAGLPVLRQKGPAPDFTLKTPGGASISLAALKGKVVFLNFWATWCGPCRVEMPSMEAVYGELKNRGFEVLAVDVQERAADVQNFLTEFGLSFPSVLDTTGRISRLYNITAFPTTFILDREGNIIIRLVGSINWNTPEMIAAFRTLLDA